MTHSGLWEQATAWEDCTFLEVQYQWKEISQLKKSLQFQRETIMERGSCFHTIKRTSKMWTTLQPYPTQNGQNPTEFWPF